MATAAQALSASFQPWDWFRDFLKQELAPYPGRAALVARMTLAATIVMILIMTFRIPYGAYGAIYALVISRENPRTTTEAVKVIVVAFVFSAIYVLTGAMLFLHDPDLRLFWVILTLFVMFFCLSALTNYTAAARFGYLLIITIPLWDRQIPLEMKVEQTLWAVGAISLGSVITVAIELIYARLQPADDLLRPIAERLAAVEEVIGNFAASGQVDEKTSSHITRLALAGNSKVRQILQRSSYSQRYREQMSAVVGLVGRIVDIAANVAPLSFNVSADTRERLTNLAREVANIRIDLLSGKTPRPFESTETAAPGIPLLSEMEKTVSLITQAFIGSQSLSAYAPMPASGDPPMKLFKADAFSNPEHLQFALKGCFAASLCYLIYSLTDWQGISTAVTTCFLTALTTVGSSRQKQILRFSGAIFGGVILGIGAQIFILPQLDSIVGFTILFVAVTIVASWFATSSPRLSYFGVQVAVAFYLINISEFAVQTSLVPARDRVIGILLGLLMMWLVFDQLWGVPAAVEIKKTFIVNLRLLAQFVREPISTDFKVAAETSYSLREAISNNFDKARALGDGVLLEFGPSRQQSLELRDQIRQWQPQLRTLFVTQVALWKYRAQLPGFELPKPIVTAQRDFDDHLAEVLDGMAGRMEGKIAERTENLDNSFKHLEETIDASNWQQGQQHLAPRHQAFLSLSRRVESVTTYLSRQM